MSYPDQDINVATDARTNLAVPPVKSAVKGATDDLARLRERWSALPSIPKLLDSRDKGADNSWPGFDVRTLLRGEESNGRWSVLSIVLAPGAELPPHAYDGSAYWFMIDGEASITIGAQAAMLSPQALAYAPPRTTQAIANRSSKQVEFVVAHSPAGAERAFAAAHALSLRRPGSAAADYLDALSRYGFFFTHGAPQPGDSQANAKAPRVDGEINTFDDLVSLRERWKQLTPTPRIVPSPEDCFSISFPPQTVRVIVSPEQTAGHASVFSGLMKTGPGAPPHHQPSEEELFIVQQGRFSLTVGTQSAVVLPGGFGFAPRYCTHSFSNEAELDAVVSSINSPGGHDRGFELINLGLPMERLFERMPAHGFQFHP